MRKRHPHISRLGVFVVVFGGLCAACYSPERDLVQDPFNRPLVHILEAVYEPEGGSVLIRWEYLGYRPVERFRLFRRLGSAVREVGSVASPPLPDSHQVVGSLRDTAVVSGERMSYRVTADGGHGGGVDSVPAEVVIPGAKLREVVPDPVRGTVEVLWNSLSDGAVAYEVVRRTSDGTEETVYRTEDPRESSFVDRNIRGDTEYTYFVRTRMSSAVWLRSRADIVRLYRLASRLDTAPSLSPQDRVRLAPGTPEMGASLLVLEARTDGVLLDQVRFEVGWAPNGTLRVYGITDQKTPLAAGPVMPKFLGLAGPPLDGASQGIQRAFIGGIASGTGQVLLKAYHLPLVTPTWTGPDGWPVESAAAPVVLSVDAWGRLWAGSGNTLKVFGADGVEAGSLSLPGAGVGDLWAAGDLLWAALPGEGHLARARIGADAPVLVWEDVALPSGVRPAALTGNRYGQVFVLDTAGRRVLVLDADGHRILSWALPPGDFQYGDISVDASGGNLVHVSNTSGGIYTYLP